MPIFVVVTTEPSPLVAERLSDMHPIEIGPTTHLVQSDSLTEDIAMKAGIKGPDRDIKGIVLRLEGAYSGFHNERVWEWMRRYSE